MCCSRFVAVLCLLAACGLSSCAPSGTPADASAGSVLLLAAASTTDALDEICRAFEQSHPGVTVRTSYAASSALAQQIEAGAAADIFLSASREWAESVARHDLVSRQRDLLGNELVIIVPADSQLTISEPADLVGAQVKHLALADPASIPAGVYARQALEKLDLWKGIEAKATGAADVRQALQFVESGAAEAGIVYATDAAASRRVRVVAQLDPALSDPIRYPLVLLKHGADNKAAQALYEFIASPGAAAIFRRHGFIVLDAPAAPPAAKPTE